MSAHILLLRLKETELARESSVKTTLKNHREQWSVRISYSTPAAEDTGEKEAA